MKHNILFDLMNEMIHSCKVPESEMKTRTALNESNNSIDKDCMVAFDLKLTSWSGSSQKAVDFVGSEMELLIFGELIDELVCEFFL